jgi:hypothetical protein
VPQLITLPLAWSRILRREQVVAGLQRHAAAHPVEMALDLAQVLGAGNDFLARVAAFVEADAANFLEIGHLRHEFFLGGQRDQREGGLNIQPAPGRCTGRSGLDRQLLPQCRSRGCRRGDHEASGIEAQHGTAFHADLQCRLRHRQAGVGQGFGGLRAGQAEQYLLVLRQTR